MVLKIESNHILLLEYQAIQRANYKLQWLTVKKRVLKGLLLNAFHDNRKAQPGCTVIFPSLVKEAVLNKLWKYGSCK